MPSIRKAVEDDVKEISRIEEKIFSKPWDFKTFVKAINDKNNIYMVALNDEHVVGYIGLWKSSECADLCNMAVDKSYQRCGIGKELLRAGISECGKQGVEKIFLEVRTSNIQAIDLYKKCGFNEISVRKGYYTKPAEDAIIMLKDISDNCYC